MQTDPLAALLTHLGREGVELSGLHGRLRYRPAERVGSKLFARLQAHRPALLAMMSAPEHEVGKPMRELSAVDPDAIAEAAYRYVERLGVAEDMGLPTDVGSPAWLIAMAEGFQAEYEVLTMTRNRRARTFGSRRFR